MKRLFWVFHLQAFVVEVLLLGIESPNEYNLSSKFSNMKKKLWGKGSTALSNKKQ
jgi:hypothetical protein